MTKYIWCYSNFPNILLFLAGRYCTVPFDRISNGKTPARCDLNKSFGAGGTTVARSDPDRSSWSGESSFGLDINSTSIDGANVSGMHLRSSYRYQMVSSELFCMLAFLPCALYILFI